ncbi:M14 family zinc carboxypeptidase [Actinacidiphila rubida]|uniref:M14 family zinc carboxypeptidase n=1 Tax=Actinacidiphila rubida TaxID=310780 RepID=UPI00159F195D|nr:M14 family zinc carboxypeptidase [Actinacidiphila rubida]
MRPRPLDQPPASAARFTRCPSPDEVVRGVERVAAARPDLCRLSVIGSSRSHRPLHLLSIGHGTRSVLVVAGAHPDESIGGASILALAEHLAEGGEPALRDTVWHLLPCLDPDGARLNRQGPPPGSMTEQYRGYFRPAVAEQPEWAPSVPGAEPMPETRALLDVIAEHRPRVQISLHSTDVGGTYAQLTRHAPGFAPAFAASAQAAGLPVETGALDAWRWASAGPGIYLLPPPGTPERPTAFPENAHRSTWLAPHAHGGMTAIVEVPGWAFSGNAVGRSGVPGGGSR